MAYDLSKLGERLKGKGLDLAEDALALIVSESFDWVAEEATLSETPYDDLLAVVAPVAKSKVLEFVDKIDGEDDPGR